VRRRVTDLMRAFPATVIAKTARGNGAFRLVNLLMSERAASFELPNCREIQEQCWLKNTIHRRRNFLRA